LVYCTLSYWFTVCCLKSHQLHFLNTVSANKPAKLCSVDLLLYVVLKLFYCNYSGNRGPKNNFLEGRMPPPDRMLVSPDLGYSLLKVQQPRARINFSFIILSYDRATASSEATSLQSAIQCFLFQFPVTSFSLRSSNSCSDLLPHISIPSIYHSVKYLRSWAG